MKTVLVIGASGFVGGHLTRALLAAGYPVRCLARNPAKVADLASAGCEIVPGDIADPAAVQRAVAGVAAVYLAIHTLSPQPGSGAGQGFMAIEKTGVQNVIAACQASGTPRVVYVTSLGISPDERSAWLRERWQIEQLLLGSGLAATVIRPGFIVGVGGLGFDTMLGNARRRIALSLGGDHPRMRPIAVDDLVYYLVGMLDQPRASGQRYDVGNDEVLSMNELIDRTAEILGRPHPSKFQLPLGLLGAFAPLIDRLGKLPQGAMKGIVDGVQVDMIGDPLPIRQLLPRPLLSFKAAVQRTLNLA